MKMLALLSDAYGSDGGIARYNRDLLTALTSSDGARRVVVLPRHGHAGPSDLPAGVWQLEPRGKLGYVPAAMRAAMRNGPFDAVFCGHLHLAPLAAIVTRLIKAPLWLQLHGQEAKGPLTRAQMWAVKQAALVTAVSRHTRQHFLRLAPIEPHRVRVLPNTVANSFMPGSAPGYLVERHGLHGKQILLTVGRLAADERGKGHDRVIRALPALAAGNPDLVYLVVGDGGDRARLEELARQAGCAGHVRFTGRVAAAELADYYRLATVFVMPSNQEGFGIVFLEAAASGLTPIGGNCDGSSDALADGVIGIAIDPESQDQLIAAIRRVLSGDRRDPAQVQRFRFDNFARHLGALVDAHLGSGPAAA
jgi:phosphatidylinositol alpha-1,6-mannosyltransferase